MNKISIHNIVIILFFHSTILFSSASPSHENEVKSLKTEIKELENQREKLIITLQKTESFSLLNLLPFGIVTFPFTMPCITKPSFSNCFFAMFYSAIFAPAFFPDSSGYKKTLASLIKLEAMVKQKKDELKNLKKNGNIEA